MTRVLLGALLGVFLLVAARFALEPWPHPPHYHANWAVYVDGQRVDLSGERHMEEVSACVGAGEVLPPQRVHMHNGEDHVVHVHHDGVAWGHLLDNLGFSVGADFLVLDDGRRFLADSTRTVKVIVNGFPAEELGRRLIRPADRLLISFGDETADQVLELQFPSVPSNAPEYDLRQDPAGCAGEMDLGVGERLRRALWG